MKNKIKVLYISFEYPPFSDGGLSVHTRELFDQLKKNKQLDIKLIIGIPSQTKSKSQDKIIKIKIPFYHNRRIGYFIFSLKIYFRFILGKSKNYDIIHTSSLFSYFFIPKPKSIFISTCHNTIYKPLLEKYYTSLKKETFRKLYYFLLAIWEKRLYTDCDKIIAVSNSTKSDIINFYKIPNNKIKVIFNGINQKRYNIESRKVKSSENSIRNLLYVGRLVPRKNLETLIKAIYILKKDISDIRLLICGKGDTKYELYLESLVNRYGLKNNIEFLGFVSDKKLTKIYSESDLFILPSLVEGFGMVLTEAMGYGLPIIATNIGGVNEVVRNNEEGILVEPRNPKDMANTISKLIKDKNLYKKYQKNAINRVNDFSWEKNANDTIKLYKTLLCNKSK